MKPELCVRLTLVLGCVFFCCFGTIGAPIQTNQDESLESALEAVLPGDHRFIIGFDRLRALSAPQLNRIAVAAARELSLRTANGDLITDETVDKLRFRNPTNDTPAESALRRLDSGNEARVYLMRDIENLGGISDPVVIEPLIDILDYPGRHTGIREEAAQVLGQLIGRQYSNADRYSKGDEHLRFVRWWGDWWAKNKDKRPVFDSEIEEGIKERVRTIERQISGDLTNYSEVSHLRPEYIRITHINPTELFNTEIDTGIQGEVAVRSAPGGTTRIAKPDDYISLRISAEFGTPAMPPFDQFPHVGQSRREVWRETLPGTDIVITVQAASKDAQFMRELSDSLAKLK
jgi:hypothetical protein